MFFHFWHIVISIKMYSNSEKNFEETHPKTQTVTIFRSKRIAFTDMLRILVITLNRPGTSLGKLWYRGYGQEFIY